MSANTALTLLIRALDGPCGQIKRDKIIPKRYSLGYYEVAAMADGHGVQNPDFIPIPEA